MADTQEQFARDDTPGITADDLAKVKSRAEAAEAVARAEQEGRKRAEQERDALAQQNAQATQRIQEEVGRRVQADEVAITNAISAAQSARDAAAKDLADALAANDATAIAKAIDAQSTAKFEMIRAEDQNRNLQTWKSNQVQRIAAEEAARKQQTEQRQDQQRDDQTRQQPTQQTQLDISGLPPGHQEFFRRHPEAMKMDAEGNMERNRIIADHWDAVGRGIVEGTPSYYEFIEGAFQGRRADPRQQQQQDSGRTLEGGDMEISLEQPQDSGSRVVRREAPVRAAGARDHEVNTRQQQSAASALPPSRAQTPANGNRDAGRITLSLGEQDAARVSFPHLIKGGDYSEAYREYARNKAELQREGRL